MVTNSNYYRSRQLGVSYIRGSCAPGLIFFPLATIFGSPIWVGATVFPTAVLYSRRRCAGQVWISIVAPPLGLASDLWGRKWVIMATLFLGWVGAIVSATANTMGICILGATISAAVFASQPLFSAM